jgi:hypothetical protein
MSVSWRYQIFLGEAGWTSLFNGQKQSLLQEWATIKASPADRTDRVVMEGDVDVAAAVAGEKCSELGDREVTAQ